MYTYEVDITRVVDGDTVEVDIDLGFNAWVKNITLRLDRIDAFETRLTKGTTEEMKALGIKAREWLQEKVENSKKCVITTTRRGKYGRWIAELTIDDMNINDALVNNGYAVYRDY